jgi:hypothetical protein
LRCFRGAKGDHYFRADPYHVIGLDADGKVNARRKSLLGWPFSELNGVQPKRAVRLRDGILGPLLAAWWVYAVACIPPEAEDRSLFSFFMDDGG